MFKEISEETRIQGRTWKYLKEIAMAPDYEESDHFVSVPFKLLTLFQLVQQSLTE